MAKKKNKNRSVKKSHHKSSPATSGALQPCKLSADKKLSADEKLPDEEVNFSPTDSSESDEVKRRALIARVLGVARKPLSLPAYIGVLAVLAVVLGCGSWGIVRGVSAFQSRSADMAEVVEARVPGLPEVKSGPIPPLEVKKTPMQDNAPSGVANFSEPDAAGVMRATVVLPSEKKNTKIVKLPLPESISGKIYALHINAPASNVIQGASCFARLENFRAYRQDTRGYLDVPDMCAAAKDGSVDMWIPVIDMGGRRDNYPEELKLKGWGVTMNLELMPIENSSPRDWDGVQPLQASGPAFIRTTSGAYKFAFHTSEGFEGTVYASQGLNFFTSENLKDGEFLFYADGASEPTPGYIFIVPSSNSMTTPWTLTEVDTGDLPGRQ